MNFENILTFIVCLLQIFSTWLNLRATERNLYLNQTIEKMLYGYVEDERGDE